MKQFKDWFKESELTPEERELKAMNNQIEVNKKLLAIARQKWTDLGMNGRTTEKGLKLSSRMATLDIKIIKAEASYKKKEVLYADHIYYRETSCKPSILLGRIGCIITVIILIGMGLISTFGG